MIRKAYIALFCLVLAALPQWAWSAHTYDTKAQTATYDTTAPKTLSYTCGAGTTLLVLMVQHTQVSRTGGAPTYNSVAMTQVGAEVLNAQEVGVEMWYMPNPPTGSAYSISVPNTGAINMRLTAASFKAQSGYTSALDQNTSTNTDGANPSLNRTTTVNGDVCVDVLGDGLLSVPTARSHTLLYNNDEGVLVFETQYGLQASAGLITMSHTIATDDVAMIMACFKEVVSGATVDLTGQGATASAGTLSVAVAVDGAVTLTGQGATGGQGTLSAAAGGTLSFSGLGATAGQGTLSAGTSENGTVDLSGLAATAGQGSLTVSGDADIAFTGITATSGQGTLDVSTSANGAVDLAGISATASPGDLAVTGTANATVDLTGGAATAGQGTLSVAESITVALFGITAISGQGDLSVRGDATISLSGQVMVASAGTITATLPGQYVPGRDKTKKIEMKGFKYLR